MPQQGESVHKSPPGAEPPGRGSPSGKEAPPGKKDNRDQKRRIKVRVSLFFDGTANNRFNTDHRLNRASKAESAAIYKEYGEADNSYANDHSNVSRLEANLCRTAPGYDYYISVYTEGIGTTNSREDTTVWGQGLGAFSTGVKAKVDKGLKSALKMLQERLPKTATIETLALDTFGFSRGAAGARYCVHRALHDKDALLRRRRWSSLKTALERAGFRVEKVEVLAVGLFDTVSSYGLNHSNDVPDLKLDAISRAKAVLQLAAADEYRENFSLTDIDSVGDKKRQIYLPGSHSDVGGGYVKGHSSDEGGRWVWREGDAEDKDLVNGWYGGHVGALAKFLLERGWCRKDELRHVVVPPDDYDPLGSETLSVKRAGISQRYSFIPLQIMADFAAEQGLSVHPRLYTTFDPTGVPALERIKRYVAAKGPSEPSDWEGHDAELCSLRHGYLHISFGTSTGMGVRILNTGSVVNPKIRPYRVVHHG